MTCLSLIMFQQLPSLCVTNMLLQTKLNENDDKQKKAITREKKKKSDAGSSSTTQRDRNQRALACGSNNCQVHTHWHPPRRRALASPARPCIHKALFYFLNNSSFKYGVARTSHCFMSQTSVDQMRDNVCTSLYFSHFIISWIELDQIQHCL